MLTDPTDPTCKTTRRRGFVGSMSDKNGIIFNIDLTVLSKLYWSVAIPRMLYGLDVQPVNETGLMELEKAYRQHCKLIQRLPQIIPNPAPLATVGWLGISGYIDIMKLCFMWRVLCMNG